MATGFGPDLTLATIARPPHAVDRENVQTCLKKWQAVLRVPFTIGRPSAGLGMAPGGRPVRGEA